MRPKHRGWYECVIICVHKQESQFWWRDPKYYRVAVHYVGWEQSWDEWIVGKSQCEKRIHKRNSHKLKRRKITNNYSYAYAHSYH